MCANIIQRWTHWIIVHLQEATDVTIDLLVASRASDEGTTGRVCNGKDLRTHGRLTCTYAYSDC